MAYTATDQIPDLALFQWGTPDSPSPKLSAPLGDQITDTTVYVTSAPLDHTGAIVSKDFVMKAQNAQSIVENIRVYAANISADGKTFTGVTRGLALEGLDCTTSDASLIVKHGADSVVGCNVNAVYANIVHACLQGKTVATGGLSFTLGDGTDSTVTVKHLDTGGEKGFIRWDDATGKAQFSDDGLAWKNIGDVTSGNLVVVSAGDTTPGNLEDKLTAGAGIVLTKVNGGADEDLRIDADIAGAAIDEPATYTPAYLTGGASPTSNHLLWTGTADGTFRGTFDGTIRDVTVDFTTATSMADVASLIQTALRLLTGDLITVVWTTRFTITSADTTSNSAITVLSATGAGTDISGAGAFAGMDSDIGNGVVTDAVIDQPADSGKIIKLDATGKIDEDFGTWAKESILTAKGSIYVADGAGSPAEVTVGTDGQVLVADSTEPTGVKWGVRSTFADSVNVSSISATGDYDTTFTPGFKAGVIDVEIGNINIPGAFDDRQVAVRMVFDGETFKFLKDETAQDHVNSGVAFGSISTSRVNKTYASRGGAEWSIVFTVVEVTSTTFKVRATTVKTGTIANIPSFNIGVIAHRT